MTRVQVNAKVIGQSAAIGVQAYSRMSDVPYLPHTRASTISQCAYPASIKVEA